MYPIQPTKLDPLYLNGQFTMDIFSKIDQKFKLTNKEIALKSPSRLYDSTNILKDM